MKKAKYLNWAERARSRAQIGLRESFGRLRVSYES
jgi:hypothetical protein